ncbi:MAG: ATP-binding cassette domain-containing protein [Intestinibaculum porci]|uniref:ATP-binding cassette domain-containing protein n=1 Tax=Intestinibaculum porci TaxID=2487118 RepID=UPI003F0531C3
MSKYILKRKGMIFALLLLSLVCSTTSIVIVSFIQKIIDSIADKYFDETLYYIILIMIIVIIGFIFNNLYIILEAKIIQKIHIEIKYDLFESLLNIPCEDFFKTSVGSKINLFENDLRNLDDAYFNNIFNVIRCIFILSVGTIYLFYLNAFEGFLLLLFSFLLFLIPTYTGKKIDISFSRYSDCKSIFISKLKEYFEGVNIIHAYSITEKIKNCFSDINFKVESSLYILKREIGFYNQLMISGNYFIISLSFAIGGLLAINKKITLGQLIAISQVINILIQPECEIASSLVEIKGTQTIRIKLKEILDKRNTKVLKTDNLNLSDNLESLEYKDVFYEVNGSPILKNINLKIDAGKKYFILGPSGCGKSTLLKVIANQIKATRGSIYFNSEKINANTNILNALVSIVYQDVFVFNDTIENNIKLYKNYSDNIFEDVIELVGLNKKIKNKLSSTSLIEGEGVSGGEKQRIAIARAILRNVPVILFDEVTSALDKDSEKIIMSKLFNMKDITMIFVSHKVDEEFLKRADHIYCLNDGMIVEDGTWKNLIKNKAYFYHIYAKE